MRQTIIWPNADPSDWLIYAAPGEDEVIHNHTLRITLNITP